MASHGTRNDRILSSRFRLRFALYSGNGPRRVGDGQPTVAVDAHADLLMVAVIDRFHPTGADRADLEYLAWISLRGIGVVRLIRRA
jgi:hypothetical protein